MKRKQITAIITAMTIVLGITACGSGNVSAEQENKEQTEKGLIQMGTERRI